MQYNEPLPPAVKHRPLTPAFGSEVTGLDVSRPLGNEILAELRATLLERQVLVVPAQGLPPEQLLALALQFGEAEVHTFHPHLGNGLERVGLLDSHDQAPASSWHTDESFLPEPPAVTLLHAQILPETGGDTCFASLAAAYEVLSRPMKTYLNGLMATHDLLKLRLLEHRNGRIDAKALAECVEQQQRSTHPAVRAHPETGVPSLFVNPLYTTHLEGVGQLESDAILAYLFEHAASPPYVLRHRWRDGDLVIWDNRCTMHMALGDYVGHRRMHRVSVLGTRPVSI